MRSSVLVRAFGAACLLVAAAFVHAAPALAEAEFCPAEAQVPQVFPAPDNDVIAFRVSATSSRSVSGDVKIQTDSGFYAASFPLLPLDLDVAKMAVAGARFDRPMYVSEPIYVRFPAPVGHVMHLWVADAQSKGDTVAGGWDAQGKFACPTVADPPTTDTGDLIATRVNPPPALAPAPTKITVAQVATPTTAITTECKQPFSGVSVTNPVPPDWPEGVYTTVPMLVRVLVTVSQDGDVLDTDVIQPSGIAAVDAAAMQSASGSTYQAGTAFCKPTIGRYIFQAKFDPR